VLLAKESNAIDHLLRPSSGSVQSLAEASVLTLEVLHPLRGNNAFYAGLAE